MCEEAKDELLKQMAELRQKVAEQAKQLAELRQVAAALAEKIERDHGQWRRTPAPTRRN